MCKGDKRGDARRGIIATLSLFQGDCSPLAAPSSDLLRIDGLVELLHLSEQDAGGVASVRAYGSYPCV